MVTPKDDVTRGNDEATEQQDDATGGTQTLLGRRSLLALAGSATLAGVIGAGTAGASASSSHPNTLLLDATGGSASCEYAIEVGDELTVVPTVANTVTSNDGTTVRGSVADGYCGIRYAGELTELTIDGVAAVSFDEDAENAMPEPSHEITITAPGSSFSYEFTTSGPVSRVTDGSDVAAERVNDRITENGDGTATVSGFTGNGYGDSYVYEGSVEAFRPLTGEFTVMIDGEEITPAELTGQEPPETRRVTITSPASNFSYEFTATDDVQRVLDGSDVAAERVNDRMSENDDGTVTVSGFTGNGYGDSYDVAGEIEQFSPLEGDYTLLVDGEETAAHELTGQEPSAPEEPEPPAEPDFDGVLTVQSSETASREYAIDVAGTAAPGPNANTFDHEYQDEVVDNDDGTVTIRGWVASASDDYEIQGNVTSIDAPSSVTFAIDGASITREALLEGTAPDEGDDGSGGNGGADGVIGGGEGYANVVTPDAATTTVSSRWALTAALRDADAGDVVYVDGDAAIDAGRTRFTVPAGVTLASDRGVDGAPGGRLYTDELHDDPWGMIEAEQGARITGLRVEGPMDPDGWTAHSRDYENTGINAVGSGVEVDNVESAYWGYACVLTEDDTHVHHCELHHANLEGLGYGVMTGSSTNPIVEYNHFHYNRHSVASSGGGGYVARHNLVEGPAISHVFDQHSPGGTTTQIYNNTVRVVQNENKDKQVPAVAIRGVPDDTADVYNNWFHNPDEPRANPDDWSDEAIIQVHVDSWQNVDYWGNHYGSSEPASDVGAPR